MPDVWLSSCRIVIASAGGARSGRFNTWTRGTTRIGDLAAHPDGGLGARFDIESYGSNPYKNGRERPILTNFSGRKTQEGANRMIAQSFRDLHYASVPRPSADVQKLGGFFRRNGTRTTDSVTTRIDLERMLDDLGVPRGKARLRYATIDPKRGLVTWFRAPARQDPQ